MIRTSIRTLACFALSFATCGFIVAPVGAQTTAEQLDQIAKLSADQFDMQKETFVEARAWLKDAKHTIANDKLKKDDVVKLVDDLYTAGALRVYLTAITPTGDGQAAPALMAVVGGQPAVRTKAFEAVNTFIKTLTTAEGKPQLTETLKVPDAGQPVLTVAFTL